MSSIHSLVLAAISLRDTRLLGQYIQLGVDLNTIQVNGHGVFDALVWSLHLFSSRENLEMFEMLCTSKGCTRNSHVFLNVESLKYAARQKM